MLTYKFKLFWPNVLGEDFWKFLKNVKYFQRKSPLKKGVVFNFHNFESSLSKCALTKLDKNLPSGFREDAENVKSLQTDGQKKLILGPAQMG